MIAQKINLFSLLFFFCFKAQALFPPELPGADFLFKQVIIPLKNSAIMRWPSAIKQWKDGICEGYLLPRENEKNHFMNLRICLERNIENGFATDYFSWSFNNNSQKVFILTYDADKAWPWNKAFNNYKNFNFQRPSTFSYFNLAFNFDKLVFNYKKSDALEWSYSANYDLGKAAISIRQERDSNRVFAKV